MSTLRYINGRIKSRRDTKTSWAESNPLLYDGELAIEMDDNSSKLKLKMKCGDGITRWNDLPYITGGGVPVATILPFAGTTIPEEYLLCNGQAVSRSDYADLFSVLGTKYGNGDGSSTFNLPNMNGRVPKGTNDNSLIGTTEEAGLPNITGGFSADDSDYYGWGGYPPSGAFYQMRSGSAQDKDSKQHNIGGIIGFDASRSNPIYGKSDTVQIPSIIVLYIIRAVE